MQKIVLNRSARFIGLAPQTAQPESLQKPAIENLDWLPISLPGDVNFALVEAGKMPDFRYDTQARDCYWVSSKEWWIRLPFERGEFDDQTADLCLDGIDGHADIWLNDHYLGVVKNAFRAYRFPLAGLLQDGENELLFRFRAIDQIMDHERFDELHGWKGRRAIIRKPQFSFGWDWALPLPSIGLAGEVWIETEANLRFVDFAVKPFISGRVDLFFEVSQAAKQAGYEIRVALSGNGADLQETVARATHRSYCTLQIPDPKLWWPNGYGEQPLYDYTVQLVIGGEVKDEKRGKLGLRESQIAERPFTEEAGPGFSFHIEINGEPIFCKGANMIPLELAPALATEEGFRWYLQKAKDAGFNMLRIWGGGVYEQTIFYDLCDEMGIMVWQDFMFASTGFPVDLLREEIIAEADYQVRRLRNHACIVLWCGCNEDAYSWRYPAPNEGEILGQTDSGPHAEPDPSLRINRYQSDPQIYSMILRGTVGLLGLGIPYVESSPQSREDVGNAPESGNSHISCWKYALFNCGEFGQGEPRHWKRHFESVCSFDSEFCIQGPSSVEMIQSFLEPENHWPPNEAWIYHVQRGHADLPHFEQTMYIAGDIFGPIDSLQDYVKHGQATHLEMMRAEFESARRDRPNNGGTMMWMFNDCWPTANWSIIDYARQPKPSYYAAKRACAPLLPMIFERAENIEFFIGHDAFGEKQVEVVYGQQTLAGERVWSRERSVTAPDNATLKFDAISRTELKLSSGDFLFLDAKVDGKTLPRVIFFPDGWREIEWPTPEFSLELLEQTEQNGEFRAKLKLQTDCFACLCHLLHPTNREIWFEDNYFDLAAKDEHVFEAVSKNRLEVGELEVGWWGTDWR